jgi:hypothetical protein
MDNIIKQLLQGIVEIEEVNTKEILVGKMSEELAEEFAKNRRAAHRQKEVVQKKVELFMAELKLEYDLEKYNDEKERLWHKVYQELNIPKEEQDAPYHFNRDTLEVFREEDIEEEEVFTLRAVGKSKLQ